MKPLPAIIYGQGQGMGAGLLIDTATGTIARIFEYQDRTKMLDTLGGFLAFSVVPGYNICIVPVKAPEMPAIALQNILDNMAAFFRSEKIEPHKPRFRRYEKN